MEIVEQKLSEMILEKKVAGRLDLDQGAGCLIVFDNPKPTGFLRPTLASISNISKVVDSLYLKIMA